MLAVTSPGRKMCTHSLREFWCFGPLWIELKTLWNTHFSMLPSASSRFACFWATYSSPPTSPQRKFHTREAVPSNFPAEKLLSWSFPSSLVVWTDPKVSHNHACENLDFSDIGGFGFQTTKSWVWKWQTPPHKKKNCGWSSFSHQKTWLSATAWNLGIPATSARSTSGDPPAAKTWKKPCRNEEKTNQHVDFCPPKWGLNLPKWGMLPSKVGI